MWHRNLHIFTSKHTEVYDVFFEDLFKLRFFTNFILTTEIFRLKYVLLLFIM